MTYKTTNSKIQKVVLGFISLLIFTVCFSQNQQDNTQNMTKRSLNQTALDSATFLAMKNKPNESLELCKKLLLDNMGTSLEDIRWRAIIKVQIAKYKCTLHATPTEHMGEYSYVSAHFTPEEKNEIYQLIEESIQLCDEHKKDEINGYREFVQMEDNDYKVLGIIAHYAGDTSKAISSFEKELNLVTNEQPNVDKEPDKYSSGWRDQMKKNIEKLPIWINRVKENKTQDCGTYGCSTNGCDTSGWTSMSNSSTGTCGCGCGKPGVMQNETGKK